MMNEKAFSFIIYCFRLIHIVVNRQLYRFAFQGFDGFGVEVVFADHDTEHVFIEPFVGECQPLWPEAAPQLFSNSHFTGLSFSSVSQATRVMAWEEPL